MCGDSLDEEVAQADPFLLFLHSLACRAIIDMLHGLASLASLAAALQVASALPTLSPRTNPSEPPPVVDVGYARYQGALNETAGVYTWRGIRYASAARFQAPRTPDKDSSGSVLNATEYGAICWQASVGANTTEGLPQNRTVDNETQPESEDCLFLDVLAPAGSCEGADLPVAVYIHGGGASCFIVIRSEHR